MSAPQTVERNTPQTSPFAPKTAFSAPGARMPVTQTLQQVAAEPSFDASDIFSSFSAKSVTREKAAEGVQLHDFFGSAPVQQQQQLQEALRRRRSAAPRQQSDDDQNIPYEKEEQKTYNRSQCEGLLLLDVTPLSIVCSSPSNGDKCAVLPIIRRNTTIPCKKSVLLTVNNIGTTNTIIDISEGERAFPKDCNKLGTMDLGPPLSLCDSCTVEVTADLDANGILTVSVVDTSNPSRCGKITITNDKGRLSAAEIKQMVRDAERYAAEDEQARKLTSSQQQASSQLPHILTFTSVPLHVTQELLLMTFRRLKATNFVADVKRLSNGMCSGSVTLKLSSEQSALHACAIGWELGWNVQYNMIPTQEGIEKKMAEYFIPILATAKSNVHALDSCLGLPEGAIRHSLEILTSSTCSSMTKTITLQQVQHSACALLELLSQAPRTLATNVDGLHSFVQRYSIFFSPQLRRFFPFEMRSACPTTCPGENVVDFSQAQNFYDPEVNKVPSGFKPCMPRGIAVEDVD